MKPGPAAPRRAGLSKRDVVRHAPVLVAVGTAAVMSLAGGTVAGSRFLIVGLSFTGLLAVLLLFIVRENAHVEGLVGERTRELARAQEELVRKEKLAALGQVAGSIAHELRNPLGAIRNATYFLNTALERELRGRVSTHLAVINREIDRSDRVITGLLDFTRGRQTNPVPTDVAEIVDDALELADLGPDIRVVRDIPEDLPRVSADDAELVQVFLNVLVNARQALAGAGRITVAAGSGNGTVSIRFIDNGPGMAPAVISRAFEPLFSTKTFGVGLGLPVCRAFVEANKGTIGVQSEPGKGTTVTVTLPVDDRQTAECETEHGDIRHSQRQSLKDEVRQ